MTSDIDKLKRLGLLFFFTGLSLKSLAVRKNTNPSEFALVNRNNKKDEQIQDADDERVCLKMK